MSRGLDDPALRVLIVPDEMVAPIIASVARGFPGPHSLVDFSRLFDDIFEDETKRIIVHKLEKRFGTESLRLVLREPTHGAEKSHVGNASTDTGMGDCFKADWGEQISVVHAD
jgi:hypothetical protein